MGRVNQVETDRRLSVLWGALTKVGSKRFRRDLLTDGSTTKLTIDITAWFGRSKITDAFSGDLIVGEPTQKASSAAPKTEHVLAIVLDELDEAQRAKLLARVTTAFEKTGELPTASESCLAAAKAWLVRLRAKKTETVAGSVVFSLAE